MTVLMSGCYAGISAPQMGIMTQDTFMFSGSIKDNIRYGSRIYDEEVIAAAKAVNAHDFIALPDGYDTDVNEINGFPPTSAS